MKNFLKLPVKTEQKLRKFFLGKTLSDGFLYRFAIYGLLISFSYIYLYPLLFMMINSLKSVDDLINPGVQWIPTALIWENYERAFQVLNLPESLIDSTIYVLKVSISATLSSALIGYGFARFEFPLKKLFFAIMLATFILPQQVTMVANMLIFRDLEIISTEWAMLLPAMTGQGINAAIYILIFYTFYKTIPGILIESAEVDGAGQLRIFRSVILPLAIPSFVIVFLFSFVWYWNESFITGLYVGDKVTLPLWLQAFRASYESIFPPGTPGAELNEAILLAGNMLTILPLLLLYFFGQQLFTQSIDKTGITGE
jgi:multiple sugar transport system permease protein